MIAIVQIKGNVRHSITLDPSVWIFDDRKIDLDTYFTDDHVEKDELEEYKKAMGKHWSREIMEGATFPPTLETEKNFEQTRDLSGTYGMYLNQFLKNAVPQEDAETISFETTDGGKYTFPLTKLDDFILKYSVDGKPITEDGPVHILFKDGSNLADPIRNVVVVNIE